MRCPLLYTVLLITFVIQVHPARCQGISKPVPFEKDKKFGYLDGKDTLVQAIYDEADSFYEGKAAVGINGHYGYINTSGKTIIPFQYRFAERFINSIAIVAEREAKGFFGPSPYCCGIIDTLGKFVLNPDCISIGDAYEGYYYFSVGGYTGYLNKRGKIIIPAIYDGYEGTCTDFIPRFSEGMIWVYKKRQFALYDSTGKQILPLDSIDAMPFYGGTSVVCRNHKCGLMNKQGKLITPYRYDLIDEFDENGVIRAEKDSLYVTLTGRMKYLFHFSLKMRTLSMKIGQRYQMVRNGAL